MSAADNHRVADHQAAVADQPPGERRTGSGATARRVLVTASVVAAVAVGLLLAWHARDVLLLIFAGILLGVFLRRLATFVSDHTPVPPSVGLAVVVLALTAALVGAFWLRGDRIVQEAAGLRETLPQAVEGLRARIEGSEFGRSVIERIPEPAALLPENPDTISRVTGVVSRTVSLLATGAIIIFLGIVFAATPRVYVRGVLALFPEKRVPRMRAVLNKLYDTLWWWLIGRLISMAFIGTVTGIGLMLLDVPLAFILALLAALLSFIPNLGPILSALPAILLGLVQSPRTALWVAILYAAVQVVETYVLAPIIDRKTVYLPPALTISVQLVMALVAGLLGVALAAPIAAALIVIITMLYVQDVLGRTDIKVRSHG